MKETDSAPPSAFQVPFSKEHELVPNGKFEDLTHGDSGLARAFPHARPLSNRRKAEDTYTPLKSDLCTPCLDKLAPYIWLVSTPVHYNINPLHAHAIHSRAIILTEDPTLHLVWVRGRIFVKPLPTYLLSYQFWESYILDAKSQESEPVRKAALGLLRSYYYLILHPSDLRIAQRPDLQLVPPSITWEQWSSFSASFYLISDAEVSPRYHYGKLQLSRLNWLTRIFLRKMDYYYLEGTYGDYFASFYGPLLFIFGVLSVLLSAMQVGMAVEAVESMRWEAFWSTCRWFSILCLVFVGAVLGALIIVFFVKSIDEIVYAVRSHWLKRWEKGRRDNPKAKFGA